LISQRNGSPEVLARAFSCTNSWSIQKWPRARRSSLLQNPGHQSEQTDCKIILVFYLPARLCTVEGAESTAWIHWRSRGPDDDLIVRPACISHQIRTMTGRAGSLALCSQRYCKLPDGYFDLRRCKLQ
jgi:hypothetical protein